MGCVLFLSAALALSAEEVDLAKRHQREAETELDGAKSKLGEALNKALNETMAVQARLKDDESRLARIATLTDGLSEGERKRKAGAALLFKNYQRCYTLVGEYARELDARDQNAATVPERLSQYKTH